MSQNTEFDPKVLAAEATTDIVVAAISNSSNPDTLTAREDIILLYQTVYDAVLERLNRV